MKKIKLMNTQILATVEEKKGCYVRSTDIRAVIRLAADATLGVGNIVEEAHQTVLSTLGLPHGESQKQTRGLTGAVYKIIRGITKLVATSVDTSLTAVEPIFEKTEINQADARERKAILAVLNGIVGDRLGEAENPLAINMHMYWQGKEIDFSKKLPKTAATAKVVLLVHGLCVDENIWHASSANQTTLSKTEMASRLEGELGYSVLYLRYNTGLHISENGTELAILLENLLDAWPVQIQELSLIGYSMGGLVLRSACHVAFEQQTRWSTLLKKMVFLATPHHGSPLERAGTWIDMILGSNRFSLPYKKLTKLRSVGINDLRYGNLLEADWARKGKRETLADKRSPVALPSGVICYALAATMAAKRSKLNDRLVGDGLVPLRSALGKHDDPEKNLHFDASAQTIVYRLNHMEVPTNPLVARHVLNWLSA